VVDVGDDVGCGLVLGDFGCEVGFGDDYDLFGSDVVGFVDDLVYLLGGVELDFFY